MKTNYEKQATDFLEKTGYMNLQQIKQAVDDGKIVCWKNDSYLVEKGGPWEYLVVFDDKPVFGLTPFNVNGHESDYFILENPCKQQ